MSFIGYFRPSHTRVWLPLCRDADYWRCWDKLLAIPKRGGERMVCAASEKVKTVPGAGTDEVADKGVKQGDLFGE